MRTAYFYCGFGLLIGAATLSAQGVAIEPDAEAARGQVLAVERCGACHATGRSEPSPLPAAPPFRSLAERYPVDSLDEALAEGITSGHPEMPSDPWEPADINRFIAYLKRLSPDADTDR